MRNVEVEKKLKEAIDFAVKNNYNVDELTKLFIEIAQSKDLENSKILYAGTHGTCLWNIDINGKLTISPANGKVGVLEEQDALHFFSPWEKHANTIYSVVVEDGVKAGACASYLFENLHLCEKMDLKGLDVSKTADFDKMFDRCSSLKSLNLGHFSPEEAKHISGMFSHCESLEFVDLSNFDARGVMTVEKMFEDCKQLKKLSLGNNFYFNYPSVAQKAQDMFKDCKKLDVGNLMLSISTPAWDCSKATTKDVSKNINLGMDR